MRHKHIDKRVLVESDSQSSCSKDQKIKNGRLSKNSSAKKSPVIVKKVMNRVIYYTELDISENKFYNDVLKNLNFGKEKKKPTYKQERMLCHSLCKYHGEVHSYMKERNKNLQLVLNKKHSGYTLLYE